MWQTDRRTDGRTDRRTDWTIHRAAWSQLKTIGHLFYVASSFVHHFIAIRKFKLKLQSGNAQFGSKLAIFLSRVTLKFDEWPWKTIGHLFYATSSFVHHFVAIGEFKLELQSGNTQIGSKSVIFLAVWPWNLTDDLENNRAPFLSNIKLYAPFHHQMWIRTGVTVRKRLSWVMTSVNLTFDLWPWPFACTSLLSWVITPQNFVMIRWWEHSQKGVTDRRTDRRTDWTIHRATWSQLKNHKGETQNYPETWPDAIEICHKLGEKNLNKLCP